jgi:hypothetical protein
VPTTVAVYYLPKIVVFFHDQTGVVIGLITWVITSVIAYHLLCCSHRYRIFKTLWIAGLFSSGVYVGACLGYFVLASSICALAIGTFIYCQIARPGKSIKTIFIAINLMVFTFFAGFITTKEWYLEARYDHKLSAVSLADGTFVKGQVMHPGAAGLLFYQHADAENSREAGVRLFRWDQVKAVELCKAKMECKDETKHKVLYIYE